jgi:hypothetical protein
VNLVHFTELERGGHFVAWEAPDLYAKDVQEFTQKMKHTRSKLRGIVRLIHSFAASCGEFDPPWIKQVVDNPAKVSTKLIRVIIRWSGYVQPFS